MILNISEVQKEKYFTNKSREGVIYKITNTINNKFYIGSTQNLIKRYYTHLNHIRTNKSTCIALIAAVKKYKEENFKFEIIKECSVENLLQEEQHYINTLNPEYNIAKIAGSNLGIKRSKEVKQKKSASQKNNWENSNYRKKHLELLSKNWKKGETHKMAKLSESCVKEIKLKIKEGLLPKQISDLLKVSYYSVKDIQRNKSWKHVEI